MKLATDPIVPQAISKPTGLRLPDLIREGSAFTVQCNGWGKGERACAMSAAALALEWRAARELPG